jgi:hypothetical protein
MELYDATGDIGDKDKHNLERAIQVLVDTPMRDLFFKKRKLARHSRRSSNFPETRHNHQAPVNN